MLSYTNEFIIPHCCLDKDLKGTVVNRTYLSIIRKLLKITLTVPLISLKDIGGYFFNLNNNG